jgi:hypothetical protein
MLQIMIVIIHITFIHRIFQWADDDDTYIGSFSSSCGKLMIATNVADFDETFIIVLLLLLSGFDVNIEHFVINHDTQSLLLDF